jgi:hypothetical protein
MAARNGLERLSVPPSPYTVLCNTTAMCESEDRDPLEALTHAIERFVAGPPLEHTPAELGSRLIRFRHGIDVLELAFARDAAVFAATDQYEVEGSVSAVDWTRHNCGMSRHAAARSITTGEQAAGLPASVAALEEGRIGFAHLALLAGTARALQSSSGETGFDERPLLDLALQHSVGRFSFDCTHARHAADAASVLAEHVSAVESRRLELINCEDGAVALRGRLDAVAGAALRAALEPLARKKGVGDDRDRPRRMGDALDELVHHSLDHGFTTDTGAERTHLQLTASVETVMGLMGAPGGDLEFAGAVPAATVQRLACDASVRRVLLGPDSAIIDVGRALRLPSGAARAALRVRDRGCVWPGCDRPASWTNAHHVVHWGHGGDTNLDNLRLLCHRHHWMVHEGGWQLVATDGRRVLAIPPSRISVTRARAPDPVRVS